jgi:hypothetical protein
LPWTAARRPAAETRRGATCCFWPLAAAWVVVLALRAIVVDEVEIEETEAMMRSRGCRGKVKRETLERATQVLIVGRERERREGGERGEEERQIETSLSSYNHTRAL